MPRGILNIVAENPEVEHVSSEVEKTGVQEHGRKYRQHIVGQQFKVLMDREK